MKRPKLNRIKTFERTEPTLDDVQKPACPELRLVQTLEMTKDHHRHSRTKMTNWKHQEQRGPERRMSNQIYREASFELMQRWGTNVLAVKQIRMRMKETWAKNVNSILTRDYWTQKWMKRRALKQLLSNRMSLGKSEYLIRSVLIALQMKKLFKQLALHWWKAGRTSMASTESVTARLNNGACGSKKLSTANWAQWRREKAKSNNALSGCSIEGDE